MEMQYSLPKDHRVINYAARTPKTTAKIYIRAQ